ncbi:MAG: hypothetical protein J7L94_12630 [Caldisericaceae bacterium]|nr:hypothetical protein [Caldisericaceae bacterium]
MKLAVGTDDLQNIRSGHFGESRLYKIFEVQDGQITSDEVRENPFVKNDHHEYEHGQTQNIMKLLSDCDIFLARSMGLHSMPKLLQKGKKPLITKITSIEDAVGKLLNGDYSNFKCFNSETNKLESCDGRL